MLTTITALLALLAILIFLKYAAQRIDHDTEVRLFEISPYLAERRKEEKYNNSCRNKVTSPSCPYTAVLPIVASYCAIVIVLVVLSLCQIKDFETNQIISLWALVMYGFLGWKSMNYFCYSCLVRGYATLAFIYFISKHLIIPVTENF